MTRTPHDQEDETTWPPFGFEDGDQFDDQNASIGTVLTNSTPKPLFALIPFGEIVVGSAAVYVVKGILPREGVTVIWGAAKSGKSFVTFDLTMHVAMGWPYRGRRVKQGPVVYFAAEGASGFRARVEAYRKARLSPNDPPPPFYMIDASLSLYRDHPALILSIRAATVGAPAIIVIDTLNRTFDGSESSDQDMTAYVNAAHAIKTAFGCAVVIVHHCGLETTRMRGHTSLIGAVEASLSVKRDAADNIVFTVEEMKDGPVGDEFLSKLQVVDVIEDEDGEMITSCVIDHLEGHTTAKKAEKTVSLPPGAKIALEALHEAIGAIGKAPPPGIEQIPSSARKTVSKADWRQYAVQRGISTSDKLPAIRNALDRASEKLVAARKIGVWDDHVWPV